MNSIQISKVIKQCTYAVDVFYKEERISGGSAVAFNSLGYLLTAAHVVVRLEHIDKDVKDTDTVILAKTNSSTYQPFRIGPCAPVISLPKYLRKSIVVDLAILIPLGQKSDIPFLEVRTSNIQIGERVLLAGYPDEVNLPFSFDSLLNYIDPDVKRQQPNIEIAKRLLMIKSGMVGHTSGFNMSDVANDISISGDILYVDNAMHSGASGGPVVDEQGKIAGIITQRALTQVPFEETPGLRVPSGTSIAITPSAIIQFLQS